MHLLLWRHAEAEDGTDDLARALTPRGRQQAERVAAWLHRHAPTPTRVLVSPAVRTRQTADALDRPYEVVPGLAPGAGPAAVLTAAGWPDAEGTVVVVGHQPFLGQVAATVLTGQSAYWSVKKAGVWWFATRQRDDDAQVVLRAMVTPDIC